MKPQAQFSRLNGPCGRSAARADATFGADCTVFGASTYEPGVPAECRIVNLPCNSCRGNKDESPREMGARVRRRGPSDRYLPTLRLNVNAAMGV